MSLTIACGFCDKPHQFYPSEIKRGRRYCSTKCGGAAGRIPLEQRMEQYSIPEPNSGCVLWLGALTFGYGVIGIRGNGTTRNHQAHRVAYEMQIGLIPEGLDLDHLCRNRACINPTHLEPVTRRVNVLRGMSRAAVIFRSGACGRGHERTKENTLTYTRRNGYEVRVCRECTRTLARERDQTVRRGVRRYAAKKALLAQRAVGDVR